jgi:hypothetical protein
VHVLAEQAMQVHDGRAEGWLLKAGHFGVIVGKN